MIRVCELRKSFGPLRAVDGITFDIQPHETFGLLGPNGAGKTTTLNMIIGLVRPDSGEIHINGAADPTRPAVRREIGVAPQALALYEDMTAAENLAFFGRLYGLRGRVLAERARAGLVRAELTERANDLVRTYSGGMKRRLHLACAMVHEPQVLLLDEPTIGVDPQARLHVLEDIDRLRRQGRTILFTTHYIEEAERLCDRVAIMDHGHILAMDTVSRMIERYGGMTVVQAEVETERGSGPGEEGHGDAETRGRGEEGHGDAGTRGRGEEGGQGCPPPESRIPNPEPGIPGMVRGNTFTVETDSPFEELRRMAAAGVRLRNLSVERPSLETVFLKLTGRRLRD